METREGEREAVGYIIGVEITLSGIGQDRLHAVVSRYDDEAFAVYDIEDIIVNAATLRVRGDRNALQLDIGISFS